MNPKLKTKVMTGDDHRDRRCLLVVVPRRPPRYASMFGNATRAGDVRGEIWRSTAGSA